MRVILVCKGFDVPEVYYAGRTRDEVRWVPKPEDAWDFGTEPCAESIRDRDKKLEGCEVRVVR